MDTYTICYFLTIVLFFVSLICSGVVKSRFKRYAEERTRSGMTGAMAAERILRANGINNVAIVQTGETRQYGNIILQKGVIL